VWFANVALSAALLINAIAANAKVSLEKEIKITDIGLYFDGNKVKRDVSTPDNGNDSYDYVFGSRITPHGDSVKRYNQYVFMTWYKGGKDNRRVNLTRYNTITESMATIEFPHQHSGFHNKPWLGESHNTIAVGISPLNGTLHLLYDMHAYSKERPIDGSLSNDYFRYSFSKLNAANVPDEEFTLALFVKDANNDYKHISLQGEENYKAFSNLTYPQFFLNSNQELLMYMREVGNSNGGYKFAKYVANQNTWTDFTQFNAMNAKSHGSEYNWGLYGNMKYVNGKLRVGFQRRSDNQTDRYRLQNGFYYAYSDNPDGSSDWKSHDGKPFAVPLIDADKIKVSEPGELINEKGQNQVHIVQGFDWNVTKKGDVHIIGKVRNVARTEEVNVHTYKPAGGSSFVTTTDFSGADKIYTSGDNLYIIGLNATGRPYIEKALGGTNDFVQVYSPKTSKRFRHGNVYIHEGKLYYYLMEKGSSSQQAIYLQIIDLDIDSTKQ